MSEIVDVSDSTVVRPRLDSALEFLRKIRFESHDSNVHQLVDRAIGELESAVYVLAEQERSVSILRAKGDELVGLISGSGVGYEIDQAIARVHEAIAWAIRHSRKQ